MSDSQDMPSPPAYSNVSYSTADGSLGPHFQTQYGGQYSGIYTSGPTTTAQPQPYVPPPSYDKLYPNQRAQVANVSYVTSQANYMSINPFSTRSTRITCRYCQQDVMTTVTYSTSCSTWLWVLFCCCFICCFAFIILCINDFKEAIHTCPSCKKELGRSDGCINRPTNY